MISNFLGYKIFEVGTGTGAGAASKFSVKPELAINCEAPQKSL
jgi:hypothetical protein